MTETAWDHLQKLQEIAKTFVAKEYPDLDGNQKRITILATVNQLIEIEKYIHTATPYAPKE